MSPLRLLPLLTLALLACESSGPDGDALPDADGDGLPDAYDCAPEDDAVHAGAAERCDGVDNDCDGATDEADATDAPTWYGDGDGDGFGNAALAVAACAAPVGFVADATDCDDGAATAFPGGEERCDGLDNDCDATVDDEPADGTPWFVDADGDGFGDEAVTVCAPTAELVAEGGDCDDTDPSVFPDAPERCDALDNDCDGGVDGVSVPTDHATISSAVAAVEPGTLICLEPGEHTDWLTLTEPVNLGSTGGSAVTTLNLAGGSLTLDHADGSRISGLTLTGLGRYSYGLYADGGDGLVLEDVVFRGNDCSAYTCYPLLYLRSADAELSDVRFEDNAWLYDNAGGYSYASHAALAQASGGSLRWVGGGASDNVIDVTVSSAGGSAQVNVESTLRVDLADLWLEDLTFRGNDVTMEAVGAYAYAYRQPAVSISTSDAVLQDVEVSGSVATLRCEATTYTSCQSYGPLAVSQGEAVLRDVRLNDNDLTLDSSSAGTGWSSLLLVYLNSASVQATGLELLGNTLLQAGTGASGADYGLYLSSTELDLRQSRLAGNTASSTLTPAVGSSYGLLYANTSTVALTNVLLAGNVAEGVAWHQGLFSGYDTAFELQNVAITENVQTDGVSRGIFGADWSVDVALENTTIDHNVVAAAGSGYPAALASLVYGSNTFSSLYSNVYGNTAAGGYLVQNGTTYDWTAEGGNLQADPAYTSTAGDPRDWDLGLAAGSALRDAGNPERLDADGSRSDIGGYGGPDGDWE